MTEPNIADIAEAAERLKGRIERTPLLRWQMLDEAAGCKVFVKPEVFQHTGSFKFRGALNKLLIIRETAPEIRHVVAYSSGNHAQGVAAAARLLGFDATIVMPADAPRMKIKKTEALGAKTVFYDRRRDDRRQMTRELAEQLNAVIVPPYDDPAVIAGQGTAGLEIAADLEALGLKPDVVIAPCSGGGLVAGLALAIHAHFPKARIYAAEPAGYDDLARSLAAGQRLSNAPAQPSICDALMAPTPGQVTFPIHLQHLTGSFAVSDDAVRSAMAIGYRDMKLVLEPGGAAALAALLHHKPAKAGETAIVLLSGGNVDAALFASAIAEA